MRKKNNIWAQFYTATNRVQYEDYLFFGVFKFDTVENYFHRRYNVENINTIEIALTACSNLAWHDFSCINWPKPKIFVKIIYLTFV